MEVEKDKMRKVLIREISQCDILTNETMPTTRHFCDKYQKSNHLLIDEIRKDQRKRSLQILNLEDNTAQQG